MKYVVRRRTASIISGSVVSLTALGPQARGQVNPLPQLRRLLVLDAPAPGRPGFTLVGQGRELRGRFRAGLDGQ